MVESEGGPMERCAGTGEHSPQANLDQGGCGCCPDCCGMDFPDGPCGDNSRDYGVMPSG